MPLHVDIKINDALLGQIHIGRWKGGTRPDDINTYLVVRGQRPQSEADWLLGAEYTHRYGDGAEKCIILGLEALARKDSQNK
jgi:hypothetical protein